MAQKNAIPTKTQQVVIKAAGLVVTDWVVVKELPNQLIIRNRYTNKHEIIDRNPKRLGM